MWKKVLIIIFLFYLFALLQNSFFPHFSLFGAIPNLVFILFFLLIFFSKNIQGHQVTLLGVTAGFFLDIFSYTYLGPSIAALIIIGFLLKWVQSLLRNREDNRPFIYFLPLFVIFLLAYTFTMGLFLHFLDPSKASIVFGSNTILSLIYNAIVASLAFYLYKKLLSSGFKKFT